MAVRELQGQRVLITGASSGIGAALARQLAGAGCRLLLTARRQHRLQKMVPELRELGASVCIVSGDITDRSTRDRLVQWIQQRWDGLDVLINNAGTGAVGPFAAASEARLRQIMELNFFAPAELIRATIPFLRQGNKPLIVNIGSVLGHVAMPKKSEYCASKFALRGLSDALRLELKDEGIDVLLVSPNTTRSEFFDVLLEKQGSVAENPWSSSPDQVARRIMQAMRRGRKQLVLTAAGRSLVQLDRFCPPLVRRLAATLERRSSEKAES
jgi:short-subunit dehydrogenase